MITGLGPNPMVGFQPPLGGMSLPDSLVDTSQFFVGTPADHRDILGPYSFRAIRTAAGNPVLAIPVGLLSGNYTVMFTLSDYDGALAGFTDLRLNVEDSSGGTAFSTPGTHSLAVNITTNLRFTLSSNGQGCRVDDFRIFAA